MEADEHVRPSSSYLTPHDSVSSHTSRRESKRRSVSVGASTSLSSPIDSITTMMRRMSSSGSSHVAHPPGSPSHCTMGMGVSIPTPGLITSLPGAAHFSGGTSVRNIHIVAWVLYIGLIVALHLVPLHTSSGYSPTPEISPNVC